MVEVTLENYTSLEYGDHSSIWIFNKYFNFVTLRAFFCKITAKTQLGKYEHIIYRFEACDLEVTFGKKL